MILSQQDLQTIAEYKPQIRTEKSLLSAAIAIILRDGPQGTEFLLMQRAKHESDPWSGQMAFPGGKVEKIDRSKKATAMRETFEEVGLELCESEYLGQLDDIYGMKANKQINVHVSSFIFKIDRDVNLQGNYEVADLVWLPLAYLDNQINAHEYYHPKKTTIRMPAVLIDQDKEQILWGLSLRMLASLHQLLDYPMSVLDIDEQAVLLHGQTNN